MLARLLEARRLLYNAALGERISAWRCARKSISFEDQTQSLTQVRQALPEDWAWVNCSAQQVTLRRLNKADWGVNTLLTVVDADGVTEVENPRLSRSGMDRQVELQQRVSRAKRGSKGWTTLPEEGEGTRIKLPLQA